ncbi:MAG TPA: isoprenylcysteine carboxylmethyltransferase family protein [Gaiellaceae bacterium]|nr:isoprenylcysteine carboxylmethyltransferase family protein [Gaiellaceae bacterium]
MHASSTSADDDRGGRWVAAQFVVMGIVLGAGFLPPGWPDSFAGLLAALGAVLSLLAAILGVWAWRTLDRSATAYPRPRDGGRLIESGPYEFVRHPIYAAGLLFFTGYALATSPVAFIPLVALALLWRNKAAYEEDLLVERYPEYREYRARVPGGFVPRPAR